jgi:hypothetical protein
MIRDTERAPILALDKGNPGASRRRKARDLFETAQLPEELRCTNEFAACFQRPCSPWS